MIFPPSLSLVCCSFVSLCVVQFSLFLYLCCYFVALCVFFVLLLLRSFFRCLSGSQLLVARKIKSEVVLTVNFLFQFFNGFILRFLGPLCPLFPDPQFFIYLVFQFISDSSQFCFVSWLKCQIKRSISCTRAPHSLLSLV